jgi:hypothetical protein
MATVRSALIALLALLLTARLGAAAERPDPVTETREPCAEFYPLRHPYFGDVHVHTAFSHDASTQGTRNTPWDAYRFARGEPLGIQPYDDQGRALRTVKLARPLDFAAVTDHAEQLGELRICQTPGLPGHDSWMCRIHRRWPRASFFLMNSKASYFASPKRFDFCGPGGRDCLAAALTAWKEIREAAEGAYDRSSACRFSSFVGYEWTASARGRNLHRNVIFRSHVVPELPASYFEAHSAPALWQRLREGCLEPRRGCDVLTIPHNSNLSGGLMFQTWNADGSPISEDDARLRAEWEPLIEVMQHKGDSECRLGAGSEDELCGFEKLPYDSFAGKFVSWRAELPGSGNFAREALEQGLVQQEKIGANPFKFGLIASTDTHLGTPGLVDEDQHPGHGGAGAPASAASPEAVPDDLEFNPGGLAVLWAEENSRDSLFAAMRRREAYGTSGPRMVVRFFGGFGLPEDLCGSDRFVEIGYRKGVPMGGDLPSSRGAPPTFAAWALRDPGTEARPGTLLQRIQIVKGWVEGGEVQERVYDVAGTAESGASVDPATCRTTGPGAGHLCSAWTDPDFDPSEHAFYYARVLENPTCRWSQYVCNAHRIDCSVPGGIAPGLEACCAEDHRRSIQERAWTSPIWYAP